MPAVFSSATSPYPSFLVSALLFLVGAIIARGSSFYRQILADEAAGKRFHAIDGLRGLLALGVFFHHAMIRYFFYLDGRWEEPASHFYTLLGHVGVALFFMITGFLFWTKGLHAQPYLKAQPMLWSRLCRLVPMYLFSMLVVFVITAVLTRFALHEPVKVVAREVAAYLSFGFLDAGTLNGIDAFRINASVQWSLKYEWLFYLFLPLGLIFARGVPFVVLAALTALLIRAAPLSAVVWNFIFGAIAAQATYLVGPVPPRWWHSKWVAGIAFVALGLVFVRFDSGYGLKQAALLFCAFVCIAQGNDLLGLLTTRAARFLGGISYSLYLMHGSVLFMIFGAANRVVPIASLPAIAIWALIALSAITLVCVCALTYRFVEHPFMRLAVPRGLRDSVEAKHEHPRPGLPAKARSSAGDAAVVLPMERIAANDSVGHH